MLRYTLYLALFLLTLVIGIKLANVYHGLWEIQNVRRAPEGEQALRLAENLAAMSRPSNRPDAREAPVGEIEEPSLKVEYLGTVPTREGLQAWFSLSNLKQEEFVLLDLNAKKEAKTIPCTLRENSRSGQSGVEIFSSTHCEINNPWLSPLDPLSDRSYGGLGVHVESLSDQLELTFDYYDGDKPHLHTITVPVDKQEYATLYK